MGTALVFVPGFYNEATFFGCGHENRIRKIFEADEGKTSNNSECTAQTDRLLFGDYGYFFEQNQKRNYVDLTGFKNLLGLVFSIKLNKII